MSCVVIAGCGYVGIELGAQLRRAGHDTWGIRRDTSVLPPWLKGIRADLREALQPGQLPANATHLCFAAAPNEHTPESYEETYVRATQQLVNTAHHMPQFERLVFISSTAVYHQTSGEWVDEDSTTQPTRFSGRALLRAESILVRSGLPHCVLRCSGIYGPGRNRLLEEVRSGRATYDPARPVYTNRVHRDDVAAAARFAIERTTLPATLLVSDENPATRETVLRWLAQRMGVAPPKALEAAAEPSRGGNKRCSSARLRALGFSFEYPDFRAGYESLLSS